MKTSKPIVADLGRVSRKRIRQLEEGRGQLLTDVLDILADIREKLGPDAENKELVPIVVVYSRKKKKSRSLIDLVL